MAAPGPICKRCGRCCESSTPTLHACDLHLVKNHHIEWANLYTLRKGEPLWDNITNKLSQASGEMIKIREGEDRACIYYSRAGKACTIYRHRPAECVSLFCEDTREFFKVYRSPRLTRAEIVNEPWLDMLLRAQESKCPYYRLADLVASIKSEGDNAVNRIIQLLRFDYELRRLAHKRLGVPECHMNLLFGRPMIEVIRVFGLKVVRMSDGSFFLTVDN